MPQDSPSRHQDQFLVRLPAGMRERIAEAAKLNNRSMNAEIVDRLAQSFGGLEGTRDMMIIALEQLHEMGYLTSELKLDFSKRPALQKPKKVRR